MSKYRDWMITLFAWLTASSLAGAQGAVVLENRRLGLTFDRTTGTLVAIHNKLAGETYQVGGDQFGVEAVEFRIEQADCKLTAIEQQGQTLKAEYETAGVTVGVTYTLAPDRHYVEKQVVLTCDRPYGLRKVVLSRPVFSADGLRLIGYRYPQFGRQPGQEPISTFFGRTAWGGFFTGVEMPFATSSLRDRQVTLGYAPSLKVRRGEKILCEPVYLGVYRRHADDDLPPAHPPIRGAEGPAKPATGEVLPLPSESDAMVAMTTAVLRPPRHGLVPMACGWHCEMEHCTYEDEKAVERDMRSLDFIAECGIDWVSDSHPWGGETAKMNSLRADDKYLPGALVQKFLRHAHQRGVKVVMWPTMNHTHPWWGQGGPFRSDQPEWLMKLKTLDGKPEIIRRIKAANCFANQPFFNWLSRINSAGLATGYYKAWCMDGSFFGDGGWFTSVVPVDCASDQHDHLPGDSNYACQRALDRLIAGVRHERPELFIEMCRPPMDLGVWSLRNVDVCFTLLESGTPPSNLAAGDDIRKWSRVRVHHHFFPHYVDQPLLFQSRYMNDKRPFLWSGKHLDYIMLSALSSSPTQLYYLPTKTGIPDKDKADIRKWLDWGRKNIAYLKVRKDLPDWPAAGKVDGSAHVIGDRGFVFLFNSNKQTLPGKFVLTNEGIGLGGQGRFRVSQHFPISHEQRILDAGAEVCWPVAAQTAVILEIQPTE